MTRSFLLGLVLFAGTSAVAEDGKLLLDFNYVLRANVDYVTGLYRVYDAPATTSRIRVKQTGSSYCDIRVSRVEYTTFNGDYARVAPYVDGEKGAVYEIKEGSLRALNIHFRQNYWDGVTCTLQIYAEGGGGQHGEEKLLGAIAYKGGFLDKAYVWASGAPRRVRFAVPAFCKDVEVLAAGTVVDDIYYSATKLGKNEFRVHPSGSHGASRVVATLNGPPGQSCDIPVFAE